MCIKCTFLVFIFENKTFTVLYNDSVRVHLESLENRLPEKNLKSEFEKIMLQLRKHKLKAIGETMGLVKEYLFTFFYVYCACFVHVSAFLTTTPIPKHPKVDRHSLRSKIHKRYENIKYLLTGISDVSGTRHILGTYSKLPFIIKDL